MRFLGNIEAKIDAKGRVFLPASFRKTLQAAGEEMLVMRKDVFQDCLVLFPKSVWDEDLDQLCSRLNRWSKRDQMVLRTYVSDVESISLDGNGRFLIPRRYLDKAGIQQAVSFIGVNNTIEIWPAEKTQEPFMDSEDFGSALEELMKPQPEGQ